MKRYLDNAERTRLRGAARKMDRIVRGHHDEMEQELRELARFMGLELPDSQLPTAPPRGLGAHATSEREGYGRPVGNLIPLRWR